MNKNIDELLERIHGLQDELEEEYRKTREEWAQKKQELADELLRQQRRYKTGLFRFMLRSRFLVVLTAPIIYLGWLPFLLMDLFVSIYQAICFPIYRIPKVRRSDYLVFDRQDLPYLNIIEKFNCFYCSYGNGVAAYTREVAARTEQYWCPIKHARRIKASHDRYPNFFDYGDAAAFQQGLNRLRKQYGDGGK
uniref:Transmembrane protein n=1 Tax=Dechloromonas aromatica (strain RCB) TaxID=159087 RepID=Q47JG4_DECAR